MESRSLSGVSLIKVYFQPGTNADSAVTSIASLAMAEISHLPPGTLPPFVLKMDSSSLPVCLVTLKGGRPFRNATQGHGAKRDQEPMAGVPGAAITQPLGAAGVRSCCMSTPYKLRIPAVELDGCGARHGRLQRCPARREMCRSDGSDYQIYANNQMTQDGRH